MADSATIESKVDESSWSHKTAVVAATLAEELGAGTIALPGYLVDLGNWAFGNEPSNYGEQAKNYIADKASEAGKAIGVHVEITEADKELVEDAESASMVLGLALGGAGIIKGGAKIAAKQIAKNAGKSVDDVVKTTIKQTDEIAETAVKQVDDVVETAVKKSADDVAETTVKKSADDVAETTIKQTDEIAETAVKKNTDSLTENYNKNLAKNTQEYTAKGLPLNQKIAARLDAAGDTAYDKLGILGTPLWGMGKYSKTWLTNPKSMVFAHGLGMAADHKFLNGCIMDNTVRLTADVIEGAIDATAYIDVDAPDNIKENLSSAASTVVAGAKDTLKHFKGELEVATNTVAEVTNTDPEEIKEAASDVVDNIPAALVPGGPFLKTAVNVTKHREDAKNITNAIKEGQTPAEAISGIAKDKVEETVEDANNLAQIVTKQDASTPAPAPTEHAEAKTDLSPDIHAALEKEHDHVHELPPVIVTASALTPEEAEEEAETETFAGNLRNKMNDVAGKVKEHIPEATGVSMVVAALADKAQTTKDKIAEKVEDGTLTDAAKNSFHDVTDKGMALASAAQEKGTQILENTSMLSGLTGMFNKVSDFFSNMFKPITDIFSGDDPVEGSTLLKIGMTALAGLAVGSLAGDNKGLGMVMGIMGMVLAASMLFDDEAQANAPQTDLEDEMKHESGGIDPALHMAPS